MCFSAIFWSEGACTAKTLHFNLKCNEKVKPNRNVRKKKSKIQ